MCGGQCACACIYMQLYQVQPQNDIIHLFNDTENPAKCIVYFTYIHTHNAHSHTHACTRIRMHTHTHTHTWHGCTMLPPRQWRRRCRQGIVDTDLREICLIRIPTRKEGMEGGRKEGREGGREGGRRGGGSTHDVTSSITPTPSNCTHLTVSTSTCTCIRTRSRALHYLTHCFPLGLPY